MGALEHSETEFRAWKVRQQADDAAFGLGYRTNPTCQFTTPFVGAVAVIQPGDIDALVDQSPECLIIA